LSYYGSFDTNDYVDGQDQCGKIFFDSVFSKQKETLKKKIILLQ